MSMAFFYVVFLFMGGPSCAMGNEWNYMFDPAVTQRLCSEAMSSTRRASGRTCKETTCLL